LRAAAGAVTTGLINLASDVTGILSVANGGTGWAAIQSGAIPYGNGSGALATTSAGTAGQVLALLNGVPTWTSTTTFSYPFQYSAGNVTLAFGTTTANTWSTLQQFNGNASSTALSALDALQVGRTATTTIRGEANATSTFAGGVQANAINVTSTTASSTFGNGIDLPVYKWLNIPNQAQVTGIIIGEVAIELHQDETDEWIVDFGHSHPVAKVLEAIAEAIALNTMLALSAKLSKDIAA
jgi:hypothetical protein